MCQGASGCWVLIPVKAPGEGKTRLSGVLDPEARRGLVAAMLQHVVTAAQACDAVERVLLVTRGDHGLGQAVSTLDDAGGGLNAALGAALAALAEPLPARAVVVSADLPALTPVDLAMLADVPPGTIAIAPDRHGTGTNALSIPSTAIATFRFQFGVGSHVAHRAEARRLGYTVDTMLSDGLEKDIDELADLADATHCLDKTL